MDGKIEGGTTSTSATEPEVLAERTPTLRRTLRGLSDAMLAALMRALETHAHELVPGRLFRSRDGSGCAVGLMLRELAPERYESPSALRFWLRDRWRRRASSYPELARNPRLRHLEWLFDSSVKELRAGRPDPSGSFPHTVGQWILREARLELDWRSIRTGIHRSGSSAEVAGVAI
ncbi:MAG: hypothetical protein ABR581_11900 [Thermoleophilaceae bacterium]